MPKVELVVIGASAGGLDGLLTIVTHLPPTLTAAVVVVMHTNSSGTSYLPEILGRVSRLPVALAVDRQKITGGRILIAPPDFHVLIDRRSLSLTRGPRENGFRPAIDPLFRTGVVRRAR
jgi:two-component system, chemotaxis family, protein-glutamate methylesterase/glutaminase